MYDVQKITISDDWDWAFRENDDIIKLIEENIDPNFDRVSLE